MSLNRVTISGNLTRDPELRVTSGNSTPVLNFGVAVNDRYRNPQTGEWNDRPNFIDCVLFGQRANALSQMLGKGKKVAIVGKLRQSTWERDGQRHTKIEVVVDDIDLMSARDGGQGAYQSQPQPTAGQAQGYQQSYQQTQGYGY